MELNMVIQNKVKLLFEKFKVPNYIMDNYYADNFFTKISCSDPEIVYLKSLPMLPELLIEALQNIDNCHNTVKVFIMRVLGVFAKGEIIFAKIFLKVNNVIAKAFSEINSPTMDPSLRVAYMEVAISLANHTSGVHWLLETEAWKEILMLCHEKRTVFVVRQTYKFASLFLWKLSDINDVANVKQVLRFILKPMIDIDWIKVESMSSEEESNICKTLEPMLQILLSTMSDENHIKERNCLVEILIEFNVATHSYLILDRMRREDVSLVITKFIFWFTIAKMFHVKPMAPNVQYAREDFIEVTVTYFNTIQGLIQRRYATVLFEYSNACNLIWGAIWKNQKPAVWELQGRKIELQSQLFVISLVPCLVYATYDRGILPPDTAEKLNYCIMKTMDGTCEHTARTAYALRDLMLQLDLQAVTLNSIKRLTCLKNNLNNDQAISIFRTLFYVLKRFDIVNEQDEHVIEDLTDDTEKLIMFHALDTLHTLVKNYNIGWHESLEVLCLYAVVYNLLKKPNLTCKFIVTALNVITVTITKFLSPNLSLLQESRPGSSMHELGNIIYMKMQDFNWEVRDSALELLLVCTELSCIKFPPFQKQIIEHKLINLAMTIALNDHEHYVRVSALKCVGAATKVSDLWETLKPEYSNVPELILEILSNNQEGMIRREACNVLCEIYQNVKISPAFKVMLYDRMVLSALNDFHWEVQLVALRFWKIVIKSRLNNQGMLDGTFPPVTFSKETRKIVTLNEVEIQKRLKIFLDELSNIGCLTVLVKLLHDDTEVDIMDAALAISTNLLEILERYNVPELLKPNDNEPRSVDEIISPIKPDVYDDESLEDEPENLSKADNVIECILDVNDISLLAGIYERQMRLHSNESDKDSEIQTRLFNLVSPYLFVTFLKNKDYKALIEQKKKWNDGIKSFSSLLDDVLGLYETNEEVNSLDCY